MTSQNDELDFKETPVHAEVSAGDDATAVLSLAEAYHMYFEIVLADTEALRKEAYRLRYQVYCVENSYEDPADNPGGLEIDQYDARSVHALLIHRPSGLVAGTVRLILPLADNLERSFPIQNLCNDPIFNDPDQIPIQKSAEISRFCISKEMRRRGKDTVYPANVEPIAPEHHRRVIPNMMLGLLEAGIMMSFQNGVTHWCAEMERPLLRLLARNGIHFNSIGQLIEFHGLRQPSYIPLDDMLSRARREKPDVWELLTGNGAHIKNSSSEDFVPNLAEAM